MSTVISALCWTFLIYGVGALIVYVAGLVRREAAHRILAAMIFWPGWVVHSVCRRRSLAQQDGGGK